MDLAALAQQATNILVPAFSALYIAGKPAVGKGKEVLIDMIYEKTFEKLGSKAGGRAQVLLEKISPKMNASLEKALIKVLRNSHDPTAEKELKKEILELLKKNTDLASEIESTILNFNVGNINELVVRDNNIFLNFNKDINGDILYKKFRDVPNSLSNYIRVRDFQNLINERTKDFIGREFIFKAIDNLLKDSDFPSGYIIISGEPGIGKTALMAQLVKNRGYIHHFNISLQGIRSTRDFLSNICAQLISRYSLNYHTLPPEALKDSGFLSGLLTQAAALGENRPIVILIDALEEAEDTDLPSYANRLYLPPTLPEGIFFVVTTREKHDYYLSVDRRTDIYLQDNDPKNLGDVRQYIWNFIKAHNDQMIPRINEWQVGENEFVNILTDKSEGNFMYLVYVLRDIRVGKLTAANVDNIRKLPQGLKDYYQRHWRLMKSQNEAHFMKYYQPVVCILATVREPVLIEQVAEWTKLDTFSISQIIQTWREFLNEVEDENDNLRYRIYHTSFQDFLNEEIGLKSYHDIIGLNALSKIPGWF